MRATLQFKVEQVVMAENSKRFVLVCQSSIFSHKVLSNIGRFGESDQSNKLIYKGKPIRGL